MSRQQSLPASDQNKHVDVVQHIAKRQHLKSRNVSTEYPTQHYYITSFVKDIVLLSIFYFFFDKQLLSMFNTQNC